LSKPSVSWKETEDEEILFTRRREKRVEIGRGVVYGLNHSRRDPVPKKGKKRGKGEYLSNTDEQCREHEEATS